MWWQEEGLLEPEKVVLAGKGYREEMDVLGTFLAEKCVQGKELTCKASRLYSAYQEWCKDAGEQAMTMRSLGQALAERGIEKKRLNHGWHYQEVDLANWI